MPIKNLHVFENLPENLDGSINPYLGLLRENQKSRTFPAFYGDELRSYPGNWIKNFEKMNPGRNFKKIWVEVGCHKGKVLMNSARAQPDVLHIGIDITFKRVVLTAQRAKEEGLDNVAVVLANGKGLAELFAPNEVDTVLVFFPDPWKKPRQRKNRLVNLEFTKALGQVLAENGRVWMKTDCIEYHKFAKEQFQKSGLQPAQSLNLKSVSQDLYVSSFEERFAKMSLPTHENIWYNI